MSFSSSRLIALDQQRPIAERFVAARSCAMLVGQKWRVPRSVVLERVRHVCGVDLLTSTIAADLPEAIAVLDAMKAQGLDAVPRPGDIR